MIGLKGLTFLAKIGSPVIKAGKYVSKKTPKSFTKFKRKTKKFVKGEIKFMKQFPEMTAGAAIVGGGLGLGAGAAYKGLKNQKLKKNDPRYKALKKKGFV